MFRSSRFARWLPCAVLVLAAGPVLAQGEDEPAGDVVAVADHEFFENRIRPLLQRRCFKCHTDDELGDLRLDSRASMLRGGASGPAVVPGDPDASLLILAVRHELPELEMPLGGKLTDQQIADLTEWVRAGAVWPGEASPAADVSPAPTVTAEQRAFWSFQPLRNPKPPAVEDDGWVRNDVDRFVKARLESEGLEPVAEAERRDLIRRASFDLIGLPPTPEEIEAFLGDPSPDAFEKVVERLLASPHYGERWGRRWLDVVRYGEDDTRGLAEDGSGRERYPSAHLYRDWVVQAFNRDMPYSRFVQAQLAADQLSLAEDEDREELVPGLGLLGIGPWYYDIAEPAVARADERHDRVDVTTRAFLGLTVGCARCHNHKYDPIPTQDYYALAGIFNNANYHEYPIGGEEVAAKLEEKKEYLEALRQELRDFQNTSNKRLSRILARQASRYMMAAWKVTGEPEMEIDKVLYEEKLDLEVLERWIDFLDDEPQHYPHLTDWQAMIADEGGDEERAQELADRFQRELQQLLVDKRKLTEKNEWIIARGTETPPDERKSTPMPNGFESFFDKHQLELDTLDRERFNLFMDVFDYDLHGTADYYNFDPGLLSFWDWGLERQLSPEEVAHLESLREEIESVREEIAEIPFAMGVKDKEPDQIADLGLHLRGSPHNLGAPVPRYFLTVLRDPEAEPFSEGSGRLGLSEAIVAHPLTARVMVNRVWRWHFGTGIVDTPSNFGKMGDPPSHPDLLEYLASGFVESGMSIKELHRQMMLSTTYRLSTRSEPENLKRDPGNRLYWRANRRRLEAEEIRDSLLMVAGRLDPELGGKSQPLADDENLRRTLYSEVSRFQIDTYLQTFDFPNPSLTAEKRFTTNVPLQNLYFMNSEFVFEQAQALATRLTGAVPEEDPEEPEPDADPKAKGDDSEGDPDDSGRVDAQELAAAAAMEDPDRIRRAYALLYGRAPVGAELDSGLTFLAQAISSEEESDGDSRVLDAWTRYTRALLSANEFRFVN